MDMLTILSAPFPPIPSQLTLTQVPDVRRADTNTDGTGIDKKMHVSTALSLSRPLPRALCPVPYRPLPPILSTPHLSGFNSALNWMCPVLCFQPNSQQGPLVPGSWMALLKHVGLAHPHTPLTMTGTFHLLVL
ncbi:hypothetical protein GALMADRAFT_776977 [Galerina marginata CBS 339.88]|uniref:Uncharacterized protein n=1 Tax=Galerina marginata (strain CBS 339.88) TaxID=685588 RepID=A0A067SLD7_GALM3|nr:hypothetical protein GALMADRAFT_776977 [Galerina marginata CBS 339.88]